MEAPSNEAEISPETGFVFDLHTATLLALWGGKASHAQQ